MQKLYKIIYNKQVNYLLRNLNVLFNLIIGSKFKLPPSGIINLNTNSGIIKIATNQTSYVTQLLYWNGYKKFEYSEIFEILTKNTTTFLDIGANIGFYSLLAAKANPRIKTYAFEPAKGPKHFLTENIRINNFEKQIIPIDLALSQSEGIIDFYEVESLKYKYLRYNLAGEGNAGTKKTSRNFIKNKVNTNTLDNFINSNNIQNIDLIKLDTEGTEVDILKSGEECIKKFQPIIICETLFNTTENDLDTFFKALDYQFFNHTNKGLVKVSSIRRTVDNKIRNCFFIPKSKLSLIEGFITAN